MKYALSLIALFSGSTTLLAQNVVVPNGPYSNDTGCLVTGLDPNGDGFLALRAGPASSHAQIGSLRNGDAAYIRTCQGKWCYVQNGAINGRETQFHGWIYTAWCSFYP